jgi:small subunit ribosomal protein S25e
MRDIVPLQPGGVAVPPKKPSISQLEKKTARAREGGAAASSEAREKAVASIIPPPIDDVVEFLREQPYVTPNLLAEKFGVRISIARQVLRDLAGKGFVRLVVGNRRLKIYAPIKEALAEVKVRKPKKK